MVHSRTIREAAAHFREVDPNTSLTETAIRNLLRQGLVPCARVGRKYLVTIEALEADTYGRYGKNAGKPPKGEKAFQKMANPLTR